jgi:hypothetical protein
MAGDTEDLSLIYESTIVPKRSLPAMRVSTIKRADFLSSKSADFLSSNELDEFISETFRVPKTAVVSFEKWLRLANNVESEGIWDELEDDWMTPAPDRQISAFLREIRRIRSDISHLSEARLFAKACIKSILARPAFSPITARRPSLSPITHPLAPGNDPVLSMLHSYAYLRRDNIGTTPDELAYWINAASYVTKPVPQNVENSLGVILDCDIPYSLSPRSQSGLLNRFVEEARLVAIFPIASVTFPATHHLAEGNWVAAFEVLLAGAGASIVLASTFSLVEWILNLPRTRK